MLLEAEMGTGGGELEQRAKASGGRTIHLAPGERREWPFKIDGRGGPYLLSVIYSNDNIGETETISAFIDGALVGFFEARDTGDDGEGWEIFVTDTAGTSMIGTGRHILTLESSGGDGCVEIDFVTLAPT